MKQTFTVTGMTCSACSAHVEKAVGKLAGVSAVNVNLLSGSMQVTYDERRLSPRRRSSAPSPPRGMARPSPAEEERSRKPVGTTPWRRRSGR